MTFNLSHLGLLSLACAVIPLQAQVAAKENKIALTLSIPSGEQSESKAGSSFADITQLKRLAGGVGWEFAPNTETTPGLQRLGMKTLRCINVDRIKGEFTPDGRFTIVAPPSRLDAHLSTCENIQARPHIIIGASVPEQLRLTVNDVRERFSIMGQTPGKQTYWNGDWQKLRAYWKAMFHHVIIEKKFRNARFEVGNEPDIDGQFPRLVGKDGPMGSKELYDAYLEVYENLSLAAEEFEAEHPGERIVLGGPAIAWAYSFKFGSFNWSEKFLEDTRAKKLKLDFIGIHFYGNIASLRGEYNSLYPAFTKMLEVTKRARDLHHAGVPIILTEWGASYHTGNNPMAMINADHRGAAWSAAFLKLMLDEKVDEALYLVTTDLGVHDAATKVTKNGWGWPSLFVNPQVFGRAWPKAPLHVFDMISRLEAERIPLLVVSGNVPGKTGVEGIASLDRASGRTTIMLWNFAAQFPEGTAPTQLGEAATVTLRLDSRSSPKNGKDGFGVKTWMVSETLSNAHTLFLAEGRIDERSQLQQVEAKDFPAGTSDYTLTLPPCSVAFITLELR